MTTAPLSPNAEAFSQPQPASPVRRAFSAAAVGGLGLLVALAVAIAAFAAAVIGVLLAAAALLLRIAPGGRKGARRGGTLLEGRRTPDGWVAETGAPDIR